MKEDLARLTRALRVEAQSLEMAARWPSAALARYGELGAWGWGIPERYGGAERSVAERLTGYVALARGDMSTALYVTQHDGAVDLVVGSGNSGLRERWLPEFARGRVLSTIGYSQLTTSRQAGRPAMEARRVDGGYRLDGVMPWVTGAPFVTNVACGAVLPDEEQLLVLLPMDTEGVEVLAPAPLAALNSSATCAVRCRGVFLPESELIAGPEPAVLSSRSALRLLLVSATGVGLGRGIADLIDETPMPSEIGARALEEGARLERQLMALAGQDEAAQSDIDALRTEVNTWLLRMAGILMLVAKGSGFRRCAPAQRMANEALFFCVWSVSGAVRDATLSRLMAG